MSSILVDRQEKLRTRARHQLRILRDTLDSIESEIDNPGRQQSSGQELSGNTFMLASTMRILDELQYLAQKESK